jgi:paraquat-inducible protein A
MATASRDLELSLVTCLIALAGDCLDRSQRTHGKNADEAVSGVSKTTAAKLATGWQLLIGPAIAVNFALFIYVLFEPILVTRISFILRSEIVLARVAYDLYNTDKLLFLVVSLFGIATPAAKMIASVYFWYCMDVHLATKHHKWLVMLGKLSMLDIMLLAVLVVAVKGIGIGSVEIRSGLYFYVVLILSSFFIAFTIDYLLERFRVLLLGREATSRTEPVNG